eukprot:6198146-Pleurochrysis_carterae.AAC.4
MRVREGEHARMRECARVCACAGAGRVCQEGGVRGGAATGATVHGAGSWQIPFVFLSYPRFLHRCYGRVELVAFA